MPRQSDDPHVVAEVLAAELRADAELAADVQQAALPLQVAVGAAQGVAAGGQRVQVAVRGGPARWGWAGGQRRGAGEDTVKGGAG